MATQGMGAPISGLSAGLQGMDRDEDVVNFVISRSEVDTWQVEDVVRQLNELSSTPKATRRYQDSIVVKFAGYDSDRRQLHHIPEVVRFMWTVSSNWPYFFHYLHKSSDAFKPVLLLLLTKEVPTEEGPTLQTAGDPEHMEHVFNALFEGMNTLYKTHGFPDSLNRTMTNKVTEVLAKVVA
jgi:hypothetical protein